MIRLTDLSVQTKVFEVYTVLAVLNKMSLTRLLFCRASARRTLGGEGEGGDAASGSGGPDGPAERRTSEAGRRVEGRDQRETSAHQPAQRVSRPQINVNITS